MRRAIVATLVAGTLSPSSVPAEADVPDYGSGSYLLEACERGLADLKNDIQAGHFMWCAGYLQGVRHMNSVYRALDPEKAVFCSPNSASVDQLRRVVVKWLEDHPERLHDHAPMLATAALQEAFPCGD